MVETKLSKDTSDITFYNGNMNIFSKWPPPRSEIYMIHSIYVNITLMIMFLVSKYRFSGTQNSFVIMKSTFV